MDHERPYVAALDGFRAVAILVVMLFHVNVPFFGLGWNGVSLFFVLSGYLITGILVDSREKGNYFFAFYGRRALRIFPVYYLVLCSGLIYGTFFHIPVSDAPWFFLYVQNFLLVAKDFDVDFPWLWYHTWSLAIEEQFYVFVPLVVWLLNLRQARFFFAALIAASVLYKLGMYWNYGTDMILRPRTFANLDQLCAGSVLACHFRLVGQQKTLRSFGILASLGALVYFTLALAAPSMFAPWNMIDQRGPGWLLLHFTAVAVTPFILLVLVTDRSPPLTRLLSSRPMRYVGRISYGLYLYHNIVFNLVDETLFHFGLQWPAWTTGFLKFALTFLISALSWVLFESPLLRLKRFFTYSERAKNTSASVG